MKLSGIVRALVLMALSLTFGYGAARASGRPNILLILADDMGYSDVSPYGGEIFTRTLHASPIRG
jgi:hypothetical protein